MKRDKLRAIVNEAIARRIFPGAVVYLAHGDELRAHEAFGTTAYEVEYSAPVTKQTVYDLASLTKPVAATAFLIAARESRVDACAPLAQFLPEFQKTDKGEITLRHLLLHDSGIEIAVQSLVGENPADWVNRIAEAPLQAPPGERVLYSCTNFFLLARVLEKIIAQPLDDFITNRVLTPLGMGRTTFHPLQYFSLNEIAPTEIVDGQVLHGVVHDEAARAWREYSGHASCGNAGLFGTAEDLSQFLRLWRDVSAHKGKGILSAEDIARALSDTVREDENSITRRGWGWQIGAVYYMDEYFSAGHAGFTGPTFWFQRNPRHLCVILNNRVYPTREGPKRFTTHRKIAQWLTFDSWFS